MRGHAEIAGGGIGGLACALMLARHGWSVRVHEQAPEIRDGGTALYLKNNACEVLEEFGAFEPLRPLGIALQRAQRINHAGKVMQDRSLVGQTRVHVLIRRLLIEALRAAAEQAGVEVQTNATAVGADPAGVLLLEDGRRLRADLVVAADGLRSRVRDSLDIGSSYRQLPTIVNRYVVAAPDFATEPIMKEHWSGRYRIGTAPCGKDLSYVYQVCPEWDREAAQLPNDVAFWSRAFPRLGRELEALSRTQATTHHYGIVHSPRWQKGRVAVIGDAAHGLPPALGQGVGLTLMNARALVAALDGMQSVDEALPAWETAMRSISDKTQQWSLRYDFFTRDWPAALWFMRPAIIWAFRSVPALGRRMRLADGGRKLIPIEAFKRADANDLAR
jgi:2-polyprenyl-6-methoxyphenol hydroxylase-like FAD-dependent oxidoreductase